MNREVWLTLDGADRLRVAPPGPFHIGRDENADICVVSLLVSRNHLRVERRDDDWWMVDTSTNGTFDTSGQRLNDVCLDRSIELRLGDPTGPTLRIEVPVDQGRNLDSSVLFEHIGRDEVDDSTRPGSKLFEDPAPPAPALHSPAPHAPPAPISAPAPAPTSSPEYSHSGSAVTATNVVIATDDGTTLVEDVTMTVQNGTLTAILGPTGAGKSTLLNTLAGNRRHHAGSLEVHGVDLYANITTLQLDIGFVPQDDIVHSQLTIDQALTYGAELRLPDGTEPAAIEQIVTRVCSELGLIDHRHKQISKLSGGQRKRASVALELLTEPSLLLLDEPTSGLDPGYEASLMQLFRRLVDGGRTILVVTHSMSSLDLCDQVVFLGTGGWIGYAGPPSGALNTLGADDYPSAFRKLESPNPSPRSQAVTPAPPETAQSVEVSYPTSAERQLTTLIKRSLALLVADPRGLAVLLGSALVPAILLAALVGNNTLSLSGGGSVGSARTLLGGIVIAAGVIGAANGLREIVKDLPIYRRERAAGLRRVSYLLAKIGVLSAVTAIQTVLLVIVATVLASPSGGNLLPARMELMVGSVLTGLASLMLGLFISAFVSSSEKALALIPVVFVAFWLFSGTVSDLAGKPVLSQIAHVSPSNWGMAAVSSTADLPALENCSMASSWGDEDEWEPVPSGQVCDARWGHSTLQWMFNLFMLTVLGFLMFLGIDWTLARKESIAYLRDDHLVGVGLKRLREVKQRLS